MYEAKKDSPAECARPIAKLDYDEYSWSTEKFHTPAILSRMRRIVYAPRIPPRPTPKLRALGIPVAAGGVGFSPFLNKPFFKSFENILEAVLEAA